MSSCYITRASIVLPDRVLPDSALLVQDGIIAAIEPEMGPDCVTVDLRGSYLLPGLIDVHCDAIEKEAEPRARVLFPLDFACAQVDRRNAAAGITTPYHAMSFAGRELGIRNNDTAARLVRTLVNFRAHGLVDNRIHCRYEITDPTSLPVLSQLMDEGMVDLLSLMDHSPGQGQFKTLDAYLDYLMGNHGMSRKQASDMVRTKLENQEGAWPRVTTLLEQAKRLGIPTASHDDDSVQRIATMRSIGVSMSEFPINMDTAQAAVTCGLPTILGAPNVLRGGSQSGSMRAIDAIHAEVLSCLCSDYLPATLVAAVFALFDQDHLSLPRAVALAASNPAQACGLLDRGQIEIGKRADLIAVERVGGQPLVSRTWSAGRLVFSANYPAVERSAETARRPTPEVVAA